MTKRPTSNRADHWPRTHAGQRACFYRKLGHRDRHAAVRALQSAVSAPLLNRASCRRERRIYNCDFWAGWHFTTSKAART
jgi:secreted Zn-dependent insulinase-like peptidase